MAEPATRKYTIDEFLAWDDGTDRRYELVRGDIVAMAPPEHAHGAIAAKAVIAIGSRLRPPCHVVTEAGIVRPDRADTYFQADLAATCRLPTPGSRYVGDPIVIVEVLSPSTAAYDRGVKLPEYRSIASIEEILLISSWERRVEHWRRTPDGWAVAEPGGDAMLHLASVSVEFTIADLYEGVTLSALPPSVARAISS
jgi:Uma2 family endonuclease